MTFGFIASDRAIPPAAVGRPRLSRVLVGLVGDANPLNCSHLLFAGTSVDFCTFIGASVTLSECLVRE
jgi:hypothetical protein